MMYKVKKIYWPILLVIDILGYMIFFYRKLKKKPKIIKKVLFIRLEHIGDMVMATPCFESFKMNYPDAKVHVLCKNLTKPIIQNNPNVDKVITYDAPWFSKRSDDKKNKLCETIKELKKERYDIIFEMHGDPRNNFIAYKVGGYSVGYACRGSGFFLNKTIEYDNNIHNVEQNLNLIKTFCKKTTSKMQLYKDDKSEKNTDELMRKNNLQNKGFIIINPVSGRKEKNLTSAEVNRFINKNRNTKIILTGAKEDSIFNGQFKAQNLIDLTGKTDILTLIALVKHAKKVIAPDTGIIHIAKAVGTDFEAIYKTTDKKTWGY